MKDGGKEIEKGVITPLDDAVSIADIEVNKDKYTAIGTEAIKEGKVAALLLAGGMVQDLAQISLRECTILVLPGTYIFLKCLLRI